MSDATPDAAMPPTASDSVVLERHPIRGALWGLLMGIGLAVVLVVTKVIDLNLTTMIAAVVVAIVVGVIWGMFGPAKPPKVASPAIPAAEPSDTRTD